MNPLLREALLWIGGAVIVALLVFAWVAFALPRLDFLADRYSVL
ncbi:MAG: hypothetical protein ACK4YP_21620 [Myxococcota bacterium]